MQKTSHSGLVYKVCSITLSKFNTCRFLTLILGTFIIMDQTACCYNVTSSETGLFKFMKVMRVTDFNKKVKKLLYHRYFFAEEELISADSNYAEP